MKKSYVTLKASMAGLLLLLLASLPVFSQTAIPTPDLIPYRKGNLWGYADRNRNLVIKPVFEEVTFFTGTQAVVKQNGKWGLINKQGQFLVSPAYESLSQPTKGLLRFYKEGRQGLLDTLGKEIVLLPKGHSFHNSYIRSSGYVDFYNGHFIVGYKDTPNEAYRYYYLNKSGKVITSQELWEAGIFQNNLAIVKMADGAGFYKTLIDTSGQIWLPKNLELVDTVSVQGNVYYKVRKRNKNIAGPQENKEIASPIKLRYGLLDSNKKAVIPVKFQAVDFQKDFVIVWDGFKKAGLWNINKSKKLTRRRFDKIETSSQPARAVVTVLDKQGVIDSTGRYIIPLRPDTISIQTQPGYTQFASLGLTSPTYFFLSNKGKRIAYNSEGKNLKAFHLGKLQAIANGLYLLTEEPPVSKAKNNGYPYPDTSPNLSLLNAAGHKISEANYKSFKIIPKNSQVVLSTYQINSYFSFTGEWLADRNRFPTQHTVKTSSVPESPEFVTEADLDGKNLNSCYYVQQKLPNGNKIIVNTCLHAVKTFGLVNPKGEVIIPFICNEIYPLSATVLAIRQYNKWGVFSTDGTVILPITYGKIVDLEDGNFFTFEQPINVRGYFILRDSTGRVISEKRFSSEPHFNYATTIIQIENENGTPGDVVEISRSGKIVSMRRPFGDRSDVPSLYKQTKPRLWKFIDITGQEVLPPIFTGAQSFKEGVAGVQMGKHWGFIDKTGKLLIEPQFESVQQFSEGKAIAKSDSGYHLVYKTGQIVFLGEYREIRPFSNGMAAVLKNTGWGFINSQGKLVVKNKYLSVTDFKEGMATYRMTTGIGYLNKKGVEVTPPVYNFVRPFQKDYGWMRNKKKWYKVNRQGLVVDSLNFKDFNLPLELNNPNREIQRTSIKEYHKLMRKNNDGTESYLGSYNMALPESEGLIAVVEYNDIWYYVDEKGNRFYEED